MDDVVWNCCVTETKETPFCVKSFHNPGKVRQTARETVHLIYDDNVDFVGLDIFEQLL
jgi:hypothetical protein